MRTVLLLSFALAALSFQAQADRLSPEGRTVQGQVRVVDGDTVALGRQRIRLFGVDAPESSQVCDVGERAWRCGAAARDMLAERIGPSHQVSCEVKDTDPYGRWIAVCVNERGEDLNGWMVRQGLAIAYTRYSDAYVREQQLAQEQGNGVWGGPFERPDEYRRQEAGEGRHQAYARSDASSSDDPLGSTVRSMMNPDRVMDASLDEAPTQPQPQRPTMRGMACAVLHAGC